MRKLRKALHKFLLKLPLRVYFKILFGTIAREETLVIFDIDNTLTIASWSRASPEKIDVRLNYRLIELLKSYRKQPQTRAILLTAREYKKYPATYKWAKTLELLSGWNSLFMVAQPIEKLDYLKRAIVKFKQVIYYDDMSYGHELGSIKMYDDVIRAICQLDLIYYGLDEIKRITDAD